ncbi:MAG: RsmD family RNA methyltransferase [Bacteroidaceae bacterium]|nr:RsmD family RNA methyltransferase [Bacteroidaceae bacterium]
MRIVSGKYKGRRFEVPHSFKARPTTDFAKENLFNILTNLIDFENSVLALDLFAGTGSITLELLSRGCEQVVSVEKDRDHYAFICKILKELGDKACMPVKADVFKYVERSKQSFDLIFADPPYALPNLDTLPDLILGNHLLKEKGLFILEHGKDYNFEQHPHFMQHRSYGAVNFSFFQPTIRATETSI